MKRIAGVRDVDELVRLSGGEDLSIGRVMAFITKGDRQVAEQVMEAGVEMRYFIAVPAVMMTPKGMEVYEPGGKLGEEALEELRMCGWRP